MNRKNVQSLPEPYIALVHNQNIAVQHERAPRGALKRSYQPDYQPAAPTAAMTTPLLPIHHQPPITSVNSGYSFYSGHFPFPWRPSALGGILHHVPRHFPLNMLAPPPPPPMNSNDLASSTPTLLQNLVKEDEVSSSAAEEAPTFKRRDTGFWIYLHFCAELYSQA